MKAAIATGTIDIDKYIHVQDDWPKPTLATAVNGKTGKLVNANEHMIVKVLACALAPGDCRLFRGMTDWAQLPKTGRPYILGSDICGMVTEIAKSETYFAVGDKVICRFDEPQPHGMCAEYACVQTRWSEKCPVSIPAIEACTLPASAAAAKYVVDRYVQAGDRVLVLGASGGVGTFVCQYAKLKSVSFLAATTTQSELATLLGVDRVIDYRKEHWWELLNEEPFDVVVDLVNGTNWTVGACRSGTPVLTPHTKYVQLITGVETDIDMRGCRIVPFMLQMLGTMLSSKLHPRRPQWIAPQALDLQPGHLKSILEDVEKKKIRVVLDPSSPFSFDTDSVRKAMKLQKSIHAHGKVVIEIAKEEPSLDVTC